MKSIRCVGVSVLMMFAICANASSSECDAACKETQIERYFERLSEVYRAGSTAADIDRLFELFGANVRYVHKEYEANFERAGWREAFMANLKRGAYRKDGSELIEVTKVIHGRRHSAVEYRYMRRKDDGALEPADEQGGLLALFGFDGQRIVLIEEYW